MMNSKPTIVEYFAEHEGYRCGYCKSPNTNFSHGMWAHSMTCQDYQDLIDRGWRRSGKYCYKPTMKVTCCPMYTIKCKATDFQMSKSQKKAIKRVNRYLITGKTGDTEGHKSEEEGGVDEGAMSEHGAAAMMLGKKTKTEDAIQLSSSMTETTTPSEKSVKSTDSTSTPGEIPVQATEQPKSGKDREPPKPGAGADPTKPTCKKAKQIRLEKRLSKKSIDGDIARTETPSKQSETKTLEDFLNEPDHVQNCAHKLEIRLVRSAPSSSQFSASFEASHKVYNSYQMKIHGDPPGKANQKQYKRFLCDSPLLIRLYRSSMEVQPFPLSFQESYSVYRKYQMAIHNDSPADCDKLGYRQFLVDSPLEEEHKEGGPACGYGSFHQQYLLDGKIIAVGVIDILPHSVSSVYLYYDPDYDFLGLGTYSALREVAFVRELQKTAPSIENYYMGFYIHSCPKMRYKGKYTPSFLVCPETYNWVPIEKCVPLLETKAYSRLEEDGIEEKDKVDDISSVLVLFQNTLMPYSVYMAMSKNKGSDQKEVKEYANLTGRPCAERMLLLRTK